MTQPPAVLILDDERENLDTCRRVFRKDLAMTLVESAVDALALLERQRFDVALVDYAMPRMNGLEFCREAAARWPQMRRILVTAHGDLGEVRAAKSSGLVDAVIMKPWEPHCVLRWIALTTGLSSLHRSVDQMRSKLR